MNLRKEPISLESVKCTAYDTDSGKCTVVMMKEPKYVKRYVTDGAVKKLWKNLHQNTLNKGIK